MKNVRDIKLSMREAMEKMKLTDIQEVTLFEKGKIIVFKGKNADGGCTFTIVTKKNNEASNDKTYLIMYSFQFKNDYDIDRCFFKKSRRCP